VGPLYKPPRGLEPIGPFSKNTGHHGETSFSTIFKKRQMEICEISRRGVKGTGSHITRFTRVPGEPKENNTKFCKGSQFPQGTPAKGKRTGSIWKNPGFRGPIEIQPGNLLACTTENWTMEKEFTGKSNSTLKVDAQYQGN